MTRRRFSILAFAVLLGGTALQAQIPRTLSYQGLLTDTVGTPLPDGSYNITFRLYQTSTGGSALWQEVRTLQTKRGVFSTNLGEVNSLSLSFDRQYWLSIQISGDPELAPRMALTASGYSLNSQKADTAAYALTAPQQGFVDSARIAGTIPNNTVSTPKLQDAAVSTAKLNFSGALSGQALMFNGANVVWGNPPASFGLPYAGVASSSNGELGAFAVRNLATSGPENGVFGRASSNDGKGVVGMAISGSGPTSGVYGESFSTNGAGVYGNASAGTGYTVGVLAGSNSTNGVGVSGSAVASSGPTQGVSGYSYSPDGTGVYGQHFSTSGIAPEVQGVTNPLSGGAYGVLGVVSPTSPGGSSAAVRGINNGTGPAGIGVWGSQDGTGYGVYGGSASGIGVVGVTTAPGGASVGVYGYSASTDPYAKGVYGSCQIGKGVFGEATATTGFGNGVEGQTSNSNGGAGVYGMALASSGTSNGVYGVTNSVDYFATAGVYGYAPLADAVGVIGWGNRYGMLGHSVNVAAGWALYAQGDMGASGNKYFQIDHPFDPANKFLNHACTEGPEPLNVYSGNVKLDANGEASVDLPTYFQEINRDYRYQLTPIGAPSTLYVAEEIQNNRFKIAGGKPGMKVSWRVEAVRNDLYVRKYAKPVEQDKPAEIRGKDLHPELFGQPKELGIGYIAELERAVANTHVEPLKLEQPHDTRRPGEMPPPNETKSKPEERKR